jgi:hypothetical protein
MLAAFLLLAAAVLLLLIHNASAISIPAPLAAAPCLPLASPQTLAYPVYAWILHVDGGGYLPSAYCDPLGRYVYFSLCNGNDTYAVQVSISSFVNEFKISGNVTLKDGFEFKQAWPDFVNINPKTCTSTLQLPISSTNPDTYVRYYLWGKNTGLDVLPQDQNTNLNAPPETWGFFGVNATSLDIVENIVGCLDRTSIYYPNVCNRTGDDNPSFCNQLVTGSLNFKPTNEHYYQDTFVEYIWCPNEACYLPPLYQRQMPCLLPTPCNALLPTPPSSESPIAYPVYLQIYPGFDEVEDFPIPGGGDDPYENPARCVLSGSEMQITFSLCNADTENAARISISAFVTTAVNPTPQFLTAWPDYTYLQRSACTRHITLAVPAVSPLDFAEYRFYFWPTSDYSTISQLPPLQVPRTTDYYLDTLNPPPMEAPYYGSAYMRPFYGENCLTFTSVYNPDECHVLGNDRNPSFCRQYFNQPAVTDIEQSEILALCAASSFRSDLEGDACWMAPFLPATLPCFEVPPPPAPPPTPAAAPTPPGGATTTAQGSTTLTSLLTTLVTTTIAATTPPANTTAPLPECSICDLVCEAENKQLLQAKCFWFLVIFGLLAVFTMLALAWCCGAAARRPYYMPTEEELDAAEEKERAEEARLAEAKREVDRLNRLTAARPGSLSSSKNKWT